MDKKRLRDLVFIFSFVIICSLLLPSNAKKTNVQKPDGKQIFEQHCASCHTGGQNNLKPSRPIAGSKELATLATFKAYLSAPPGHMPYFESVVNDKATLDALYRYCQSLKKQAAKQA